MSYAQAAPNYELCQKDYHCGNLTAGYPFWGGDRPEFCGHPAFNLSCENEDDAKGEKFSVIDMDGMRFRVVEIDESAYRLRIARSDLWKIPCTNDGLANNTNTKLDYRFFDFVESANENLTLFYNCSGFQSLSALVPESLNCPLGYKNTEGSWLVGSIYYVKESILGYYSENSWFYDCYKNIAKVPVLYINMDKLAFQGSSSLQSSINEGFDVEYAQVGSMCQDCETADQLCVHNGSFLCVNISSGRKRSWKLWTGIGAGTSTIILLTCAAYCLIRRNNKLMNKTQADLKVETFLRHHGSLTPKRYMYSEIKKMTDSFKEKLGQGGYGSVYKGKIPNGQFVAVKLLNVSKGNGEDFINEVASISTTSHVNVVTLLGFCLQGKKRALVYEFFPNGSLEKFIFSNKTPFEANLHIRWEKLHQIMIGIARGLEYLHKGCNTRILHFDIKPHNILLDDEFCPKISDFGLAKLCSTNDSKVSMLEARGTIGYIAPEVFSRNFGPVSHKSDVYSYGMMLLEMLGGRKNLDVVVSDASELYFPEWIYMRLELGTEFQGVMTQESEIVRKMTLVGLWCIQTNPSNRPSISKVIEMLEGNIEALEIPPRPFLSPSPRAAYQLGSMSDSTMDTQNCSQIMLSNA